MSNITPPGFRAFNPTDVDRPLKIYRRNLPHWRQKDATYFLTIHTGDALSQQALDELVELREQYRQRNNDTTDKEGEAEFGKLLAQRTEYWLDRGYGECWFKKLELRKILHTAILHFHGERVEVGAFTILPNHLHVLARMLTDHDLEDWTGSIKQFTSSHVNKSSGHKGSIWEQEGFDRIVRDSKHLRNCVAYIGRNLEHAGLPSEMAFGRWVNPAWEALGWGFPG